MVQTRKGGKKLKKTTGERMVVFDILISGTASDQND
jgi:hypothetical protein